MASRIKSRRRRRVIEEKKETFSEAFTNPEMEEKYNDEPEIKQEIIIEHIEKSNIVEDPDHTELEAVAINEDVMEIREVEEKKEEVIDLKELSKKHKPLVYKKRPVDKLIEQVNMLDKSPDNIILFIKKNKRKINRLTKQDKLMFMDLIAEIYK